MYNYQLPQLKLQGYKHNNPYPSLKEHIEKVNIHNEFKKIYLLNYTEISEKNINSKINQMMKKVTDEYNGMMSKYVVSYYRFPDNLNIINLNPLNIEKEFTNISKYEIIDNVKKGKKILLDNLYLKRVHVANNNTSIYDTYDNEFIYLYTDRELINIPIHYCYFPSYEDNLCKLLLLFISNYSSETSIPDIYITFINDKNQKDEGIIKLLGIRVFFPFNIDMGMHVETCIRSFNSRRRHYIYFQILLDGKINIINKNDIKIISFMKYIPRETKFYMERSIECNKLFTEDISLLNNIIDYYRIGNRLINTSQFYNYINNILKKTDSEDNTNKKAILQFSEYNKIKKNFENKIILNLILVNKRLNYILPLELWMVICSFTGIKF